MSRDVQKWSDHPRLRPDAEPYLLAVSPGWVAKECTGEQLQRGVGLPRVLQGVPCPHPASAKFLVQQSRREDKTGGQAE